MGRGRWVSHIKGAPDRNWDEEQRTPEYIQLVRVQKGQTHRIRLYRDRANSRGPGDSDYQMLYEGGWE